MSDALPSDLDSLIACHDCDKLYRKRILAPGAKALCLRCGATLYTRSKDMLDRSLAFTLASLVLLAVTCSFRFMEFHLGGKVQDNRFASGIQTLWEGGYGELGVMVAFTSMAAPAVLILAFLAILVPLRMGRRSRYIGHLTKLVTRIRPWSMMEVYLLAVIVAVFKLNAMAEIVLDAACYAFFVMVFTLTAAIANFDAEAVWEELGS
jgi:paraquat-inducible protein A